jgi:RNA polymerase subunit RPABC4/transcription elongation factor Spt4
MLDTLGQLLGPLFDAIGAFLSSPAVQFFLTIALIYILVLWLAAAWWVFRDATQRTRNVVVPYLAAAPIILATPLGFIFVLVVWRIIRPTQTLAAAAEHDLATDALKAEAADLLYCATCGRRVDREWILCPTCRSRLARVCPACKRLVGLDWSLCAWCGRDFEVPRTALRAQSPSTFLEAPEAEVFALPPTRPESLSRGGGVEEVAPGAPSEAPSTVEGETEGRTTTPPRGVHPPVR